MSKNILILSPALLKERTALHDNVEEKLIYPEIKAAQDLNVPPLTGTALYDKLLSDIEAGTLSGDYKTFVDEYLIDMLANYVMAELPLGITYQIWNKGVAAKTTDASNTPSMSELFDIANKYKNRAEHYEKRARKFLQQWGPTKYPEYLQPGSQIDTIVPKRNDFSNPIYLGEDTQTYKSYEERYQGYNPQCC
jgi:hypothetical protein